ncbi:GNAT family N-acetyltransferase [Candidatus Saccharibacteria bacterium]|nr:GNAT family N-acetyltransferase [Candidatus Saccharibacteria bacterium]
MAAVKSIRETIDPEDTLPPVELIVDPSKRSSRGTVQPRGMLIVSDGEIIGSATIVTHIRGGFEHFNGVKLDSRYRGKGYGMATYLAAIEHAHSEGREWRSHDWTQTGAAAKVWQQFIDSGIAEVVEPLTYVGTEENGIEKYTSDIRIPPSSPTT